MSLNIYYIENTITYYKYKDLSLTECGQKIIAYAFVYIMQSLFFK